MYSGTDYRPSAQPHPNAEPSVSLGMIIKKVTPINDEIQANNSSDYGEQQTFKAERHFVQPIRNARDMRGRFIF
jgi:hypothetical protein